MAKIIRLCLYIVICLTFNACVSTPVIAVKREYQYQYTLYKTTDNTTPAANTPYYLSIKDFALSNQPKKSYDGVTNAQGQTIVVHSDREIKPEDVTLSERFGEGDFGEIFQVFDSEEVTASPTAYRITIHCPKKPAQTILGVTNRNGFTKYIATKEACKLKLSLDPIASALLKVGRTQ